MLIQYRINFVSHYINPNIPPSAQYTMNGRSYKKLYDIPSIPDSMIKQKFMSTTDDYWDPNTVENFMMEALRSTGPEKPLFEHELPRKDNPHRDMMLRLHAEGSPYSHDPYHPELFLGDLTADPRGIENTPNVSQIAEQSRFRQRRYIAGKLQDDPDRRVEGVASSAAINRAVHGGFADTSTRMTNLFDDSIDAAVRKSNPNPGRTIQQVGDSLKEDQKFHQSQSEMIIPSMGYNPISLLSNQTGIHWMEKPEGKFGLSSVSNTYRSKGAVDAAANAAFRVGKQDEKFGESHIQFITSMMSQMTDAIKRNKQNQMDAEVTISTDSRKNAFINRIAHPSRAPGGDAVRGTQLMQKQGFQVAHKQTHLKPHNSNNQVRLGITEPLKNAKQMVLPTNGMAIPKKDHLKIMRSIKRDSKATRIGAEHFVTRYTTNAKILSNAFTHRVQQFREKNGRNAAQVREETEHYSQATLHKPEDRVSNIRTTKSKFNNAKELLDVKPTGAGQTKTIAPINMGNYEFDTDPATDNAFMTRRNSAQKMGYIFNQRIYDNDIAPLAEVINTRRYISSPNDTKSTVLK
jgi:hypothetical protein